LNLLADLPVVEVAVETLGRVEHACEIGHFGHVPIGEVAVEGFGPLEHHRHIGHLDGLVGHGREKGGDVGIEDNRVLEHLSRACHLGHVADGEGLVEGGAVGEPVDPQQVAIGRMFGITKSIFLQRNLFFQTNLQQNL